MAARKAENMKDKKLEKAEKAAKKQEKAEKGVTKEKAAKKEKKAKEAKPEKADKPSSKSKRAVAASNGDEPAAKKSKKVVDAGTKESKEGEVPKPLRPSAAAPKAAAAVAAATAAAGESPAADSIDGGKPAADPALLLDNFEMSASIKSLLRAQGIESLFAIQAQTFPFGVSGFDVVGRARTGCGKTLGFTLPMVENLLKDKAGGTFKVGTGVGRPPSCIVMLPTRELAKQVQEVVSMVGKAAGLTVLTVYGGTPYESQESVLRRGVDVVVGTPGRIKDLMARGRLKLDAIRYRVLDEVDRMMQMGFIEDVETILQAEEGHQAGIQTFLFSATMPKWIKDLCKRFLKPDHKTVDLIGDDRATQTAATTVRHMMLPCHFTQRPSLVRDLITSWGLGGRSIVFTDTKSDANDIAASLSDSGIGARCLHGDMPQKAREEALQGFKTSKFNTLVATDVAARGLDVASVELVVMMDAPSDWETYIHRSGRTGRAGAKGTSIMFVTRRMEYMPPIIEAKARFKFERIGAPQPNDMAAVAATRAVEMLADVDRSVVPFFETAAAGFLEACTSPLEALSIALAKIAGVQQMKSRSLLNADEGYTTLHFVCDHEVSSPGSVWGYLRKVCRIDEDTLNAVKGMTLTADSKGAVFDVPSNSADAFVESASGKTGLALTVASVLPEIKARDRPPPQANGFGSGRGGFGGGGFGRGGGGFGRGGGGRGGGGSGGRGRGGRGGRGRF